MQAYSLDLRERVVRAVDQGYPRHEISKLLGISSATSSDDAKPDTSTDSPFLVVLLRKAPPCVKVW
jgi:hypothetical protein